jgi:hypothetical protein
MDLLTVTCDRDFELMLLQAESIHLFLTPCTHWVIINEELVDIEYWKTALSPYYTNHTLKLLTIKDFKPINSKQGWVRQQVLKLRIAEYTDNDYLILDTKFFFVKSTDLSFWENKIGDGNLYTLDSSSAYSCWRPASKLYASKLGVPELEDIFFTSPFKIKIEYLKKVDMDFLQECLLVNSELGPTYVSEYVLYSYLARNEIKHNTGKILEINDVSLVTPKNVRNLSNEEGLAFIIRKSLKAKNDNNIKTLAFHPRYLMSASKQHLYFINYFLKSLGFTTQLYPK